MSEERRPSRFLGHPDYAPGGVTRTEGPDFGLLDQFTPQIRRLALDCWLLLPQAHSIGFTAAFLELVTLADQAVRQDTPDEV